MYVKDSDFVIATDVSGFGQSTSDRTYRVVAQGSDHSLVRTGCMKFDVKKRRYNNHGYYPCNNGAGRVYFPDMLDYFRMDYRNSYGL